MGKMILIDSEKCVGCRNCTLACSFANEQLFGLSKARITTYWLYRAGRHLTMMCQHCASPPCMDVCPMEAISRNEDTGAIVIDPDQCIGCKMCMVVCPVGGVTWDADSRRMIKCDLCNGEPECVKHCLYGALTWVDAGEAAVNIRQMGARHIAEAMYNYIE